MAIDMSKLKPKSIKVKANQVAVGDYVDQAEKLELEASKSRSVVQNIANMQEGMRQMNAMKESN